MNKINLIQKELDSFGKISLVTNYSTARDVLASYLDYNYKDYIGIDLQSDVELYIIDVIENEAFIIEPLKRNGNFLDIECDTLVIDEDIEDFLNLDFYKKLEVEESIKLKDIERK